MMAHLILKWGTLKGWREIDENHPAAEYLRRYNSGRVSVSAMAQKDDEPQKKALCDLIDAVDTVHNDWTGEDMTKDEAKEYVMNYRK